MTEPTTIHFPAEGSDGKNVEVWQDADGDIQVRVIDNVDCLVTRVRVSGAGVERAWHPGPGGDDDTPEEVAGLE